jgi:hypothetical protein
MDLLGWRPEKRSLAKAYQIEVLAEPHFHFLPYIISVSLLGDAT